MSWLTTSGSQAVVPPGANVSVPRNRLTLTGLPVVPVATRMGVTQPYWPPLGSLTTKAVRPFGATATWTGVRGTVIGRLARPVAVVIGTTVSEPRSAAYRILPS